MLSRCAVEIHTLPVNQEYSLKHPPFEGIIEALHSYRSGKLRSRQNVGDTPGISGNVFANPQASSTAPYLQELNSTWKKTIEEPLSHVYNGEEWETRTKSRSEMPVRTVSPKIQSSAVEEDSSKNYGSRPTTDCRFLIFHFDKFLTPGTFACWKIRVQGPMYVLVRNFLRKRCNGSKEWSCLIQWMNWDLRHLLVVFQCRTLKVLDARDCFSTEQDHP